VMQSDVAGIRTEGVLAASHPGELPKPVKL